MSLTMTSIRNAWTKLDRRARPVSVTINRAGLFAIRVGAVREGTPGELAGYFTQSIALIDFADAIDVALDAFEVRPRRKAA